MLPRSTALRVLLGVLAFLLLVVIGAGCFVAYLNTENGRRFGKVKIASFVSDNIPGKLTIRSIDELTLTRVVANDVKFTHPDGTVMLHAKHAVVIPDVGMALRGMLGFESAAVDGGFIVLSVDPDGRLGMEAAVDTKTDPTKPHDPYGGLHYDMRSMHVQHFTTVVRVIPGETGRLQNTTGVIGVRRIETSGTQVTFDHVSGDLDREIAGAKIRVNTTTGWIHGKEKQVGHFKADLKIGSGKIEATIDYFDRKEKPIRIKLHDDKGIEGFGTAWLLRAAAAFTDKIDLS